MLRRLVAVLFVAFLSTGSLSAGELRLGVFDIDATPPVGSPLAYDTMEGSVGTLRCKGLVFLGDDEPIVLVAIDWLGVGGEGHDRIREAIGKAVGTPVERVAVHALHQHDAPRFDLGAERVLADGGLAGRMFNVPWSRQFVEELVTAAKQARDGARRITHIAAGSAKVEQVASNRRILGEDGKVEHVRFTATRDPEIRAFPEGTIDPLLRSVAFHAGDELVAVATWYACHPQSYYRTKLANADFPGLAREARQRELGVPHVHFNGAGGNIGAGKYNDGAKENRAVLAGRVEQGMKLAHGAAEKRAVTAKDLGWAVEKVQLPLAEHLDEENLRGVMLDEQQKLLTRILAGKAIAYMQRVRGGRKIDIGCLTLGNVRVLHMPGELFVEYQLAAAAMRPDLFVAMAAYGDYAPGYIGTKIAYGEGGYETSDRATRVTPGTEAILTAAMRKLLDAPEAQGTE